MFRMNYWIWLENATCSRFSPKLVQELMVRNIIQFQKSMTMRNSLEDSNVIIQKSTTLIRNELDDASVCYGVFAYVSCLMLFLFNINMLRSHYVESHVVFLFVCYFESKLSVCKQLQTSINSMPYVPQIMCLIFYIFFGQWQY